MWDVQLNINKIFWWSSPSMKIIRTSVSTPLIPCPLQVVSTVLTKHLSPKDEVSGLRMGPRPGWEEVGQVVDDPGLSQDSLVSGRQRRSVSRL